MSTAAPETSRLRLAVVGVVVVSLFAALFSRLWYLQVMDAPTLQVRADQNRIRIVHEMTRARQPARADAPNVLVLLVDTLRADAVGCYGAVPSPTPALDALAGRGIVFTHAVSQSSWTKTSMASLWTGTFPIHNGILRYSQGTADNGFSFSRTTSGAGLSSRNP